MGPARLGQEGPGDAEAQGGIRPSPLCVGRGLVAAPRAVNLSLSPVRVQVLGYPTSGLGFGLSGSGFPCDREGVGLV